LIEDKKREQKWHVHHNNSNSPTDKVYWANNTPTEKYFSGKQHSDDQVTAAIVEQSRPTHSYIMADPLGGNISNCQ